MAAIRSKAKFAVAIELIISNVRNITNIAKTDHGWDASETAGYHHPYQKHRSSTVQDTFDLELMV